VGLRQGIGRLPGARALAHRIRSAWQAVQPLPRPRYRPSTPRIGGDDPWDPFLPPTALTLGAAALSPEASSCVLALFDRLTPHDDYAMARFHLTWARDRFGAYWRYADLHTALWAAATLVRPDGYLEIGVNRGRSAALVGSLRPTCAIYGFDAWIEGYADAANPGPDFVRDELRRAGHTGNVTLVSGDSRTTLPAFLTAHPDLFFDLVTVDGDKSVRGFSGDLAHALPRLKVGGVLAVDDLAAVPALRRVWREVIERDARFVTWEFVDAGYGVAAAVRTA
jgi:predicted O-methyltransferase YrrM